MGFFEFISHAIPAVVNSTDASNRATRAILTKADAARDANEKSRLSSADIQTKPVLVKLQRQDEETRHIIDSVTMILDNIEVQMDAWQKSLSKKVDINAGQAREDLRHSVYKALLTEVKTAGQWMEEKQPDLRRITAMSGDPNFDTIFKKPGNILNAKRDLKKAVNSLTTEISDPDHVPAQDMFDLYLQGVHWLLVFDKAIIVTRDIWAKHCFKDKQWGRYLDALKDLSDDINMLHIDSLQSRTTLLKTIQNILGKDSAMSRRASAIKDSDNSIKDEWAPLTLGWMDASKVKEDLKLENVTVTSHDTITLESAVQRETAANYWRELADQTLDSHLSPARAVIQSVEENVRQWSRHVPVIPKTLSTPDAHVKGTVVAKPTSFHRRFPAQRNHNLAGKTLSYTVTYVTQFGESTAADFSANLETEDTDRYVELLLHKVVVENDLRDKLDAVLKQKDELVEPDRGTGRRVYVSYSNTEEDGKIYLFIGEVDESVDTVVHELNPN